MAYDYKENLKAFIEKKNMSLRIMQLMIDVLRYDCDIDTSNITNLDELLTLYLQKRHYSIDYGSFFDFLCDWSAQPEHIENTMFWRDLHHEWQRIAAKKIVLVTPIYKSIW